ncbi:MAG: hypothetical protein QXY50_02870 [Candidatus Caldarchaeum sp.]
MSAFGKLLQRIRRHSTPEAEDLERLGISVTANMIQLARLNAIEDYQRELNELLQRNEPVEALNRFNSMLQAVATPFLAARNNPVLAAALRDWTELYGTVKNMWDARTFDEPAENIPAIKKQFTRFIERNILPAGYMVLALAWSEKDITPSYVNVIKAQGGATPATIIAPKANVEEER